MLQVATRTKGIGLDVADAGAQALSGAAQSLAAGAGQAPGGHAFLHFALGARHSRAAARSGRNDREEATAVAGVGARAHGGAEPIAAPTAPAQWFVAVPRINWGERRILLWSLGGNRFSRASVAAPLT